MQPENERAITPACNHGRSRVNGFPMDMTATHGWLFVYVRCWACDFRQRLGWRWHFRSVGHAVNYWWTHYGWRRDWPETADA